MHESSSGITMSHEMSTQPHHASSECMHASTHLTQLTRLTDPTLSLCLCLLQAVLDQQGCMECHCCVLRPAGNSRSSNGGAANTPTLPGSATSSSTTNSSSAGALLVVGRRDGLYEFNADTRAGASALEGQKVRLDTLGRFVVVVSGACLSSCTDVYQKRIQVTSTDAILYALVHHPGDICFE